MTTIGKNKRKGFESLIAHLLFSAENKPFRLFRYSQLSRVHVSKVMTFVNIDNFMETSSLTTSASKKGLESCDSKPLYERPTLAMRVEAGKTNTISGLCRMRADGCRSSHR